MTRSELDEELRTLLSEAAVAHEHLRGIAAEVAALREKLPSAEPTEEAPEPPIPSA